MQPNNIPPYPCHHTHPVHTHHTHPTHTFTTDCVTEFPKSAARHNAIAVFVDEVSKYDILVPFDNESSDSHGAHMYNIWTLCMSTLACMDTYCLTW